MPNRNIERKQTKQQKHHKKCQTETIKENKKTKTNTIKRRSNKKLKEQKLKLHWCRSGAVLKGRSPVHSLPGRSRNAAPGSGTQTHKMNIKITHQKICSCAANKWLSTTLRNNIPNERKRVVVLAQVRKVYALFWKPSRRQYFHALFLSVSCIGIRKENVNMSTYRWCLGRAVRNNSSPPLVCLSRDEHIANFWSWWVELERGKMWLCARVFQYCIAS